MTIAMMMMIIKPSPIRRVGLSIDHLQKIPYHTIMLFVCHPTILHKHCLQFLLGVKVAPRETENNAYAKVGGYKQRALWYGMVFSGRGELLLITTNPTERWS